MTKICVEKRKKVINIEKGGNIEKKRVIHEVINVIHRKKGKNIGLHRKRIEHSFCTQIIKLISFAKKREKILTFQK